MLGEEVRVLLLCDRLRTQRKEELGLCTDRGQHDASADGMGHSQGAGHWTVQSLSRGYLIADSFL